MVQTRSDWELEVIDALTGGINVSVRPDMLNKTELSNASNVFSEDGRVLIDTGYTTFAGTVRGKPRATYQFFMTTGSSELVLVTNDTFYKLASSEWQYVSDGTDTTCTDGEPAGETSIVVSDITGFSDADYVGITLDDGTQHQTTINGAPSGSTIVITDAIPVGRTVSIGAAFVKAVELNGTLDILTSFVTLPINDWLVFTNGVDVVKRYDGTTCENVPNLPSSGNTVCRIVASSNNHLLLLNTTEGGTRYPQRVRNSDTGDPTNWTTGNAGYTDLIDTEDFIVASSDLGPYHIIYKERTIVRMEWVGSDDRLFNFNTVIEGEGALSQDSVVSLGDYHIFVGNANINEYRGGFSFTPIGDKIYSTVFGSKGDINPSYRIRTFIIYVEELDEVWVMYPAGASEVPNKTLRYKVSEQSWWPREFNVSFIGFGFYQKTSSKIWTELEGTWADQNWQWSSNLLLVNSPTTQLCADSPNQVYEYDYSTVDDNGTDISYSIETKDFKHPHFLIKTDMFEFFLKGTSVLIEYSTDKGSTWNTLGTVSPGSTFTKVRLWKQIVSETIRFRLSGTGGGFSFEWMTFEFMLDSEW